MNNKQILGWLMIAAAVFMLFLIVGITFIGFGFNIGTINRLYEAFAGDLDVGELLQLFAALIFQAAYLAGMIALVFYGKKFIQNKAAAKE